MFGFLKKKEKQSSKNDKPIPSKSKGSDSEIEMTENFSMPLYSEVWGYFLGLEDRPNVKKIYGEVSKFVGDQTQSKEFVFSEKQKIGVRIYEDSPILISYTMLPGQGYTAAFPVLVPTTKISGIIRKAKLNDEANEGILGVRVFEAGLDIHKVDYTLTRRESIRGGKRDFFIYGIGTSIRKFDLVKANEKAPEFVGGSSIYSEKTTAYFPASPEVPNLYSSIAKVLEADEFDWMGNLFLKLKLKIADTGDWNIAFDVLFNRNLVEGDIKKGDQIEASFGVYGYERMGEMFFKGVKGELFSG